MATRAWRRRADSGRAVPGAAQRLALRGTAAHRQARDHPQRQSRSAEAVLYGLVSPRPDGRDRRRRLQQGRDRGADQIAFRCDPGPPHPGRDPRYTVPNQTGTTYSVITDPEATSTRISVTSTMKAREQMRSARIASTNGGAAVRRDVVDARLDEIAQAPNAPFLRAQTDRSLFVKSIEVTSLDALVATGGVERGLAALFTELARVARFGFTAPELTRMKLNLERGLERAVIEKDKSPSGPLADEFVRNFIQQEPIPGIVYEYGLNQRFSPEITLAEVNARGQGLDARFATGSSRSRRPRATRRPCPTR